MAMNPRLRSLLVWLLASLFALAAVAAGAAADVVKPQSISGAAPVALQRSAHHKRHRRHKRHHRAKVSRASGLTVSTTSPSSSQTLSGGVNWQVAVSGATPTRVD